MPAPPPPPAEVAPPPPPPQAAAPPPAHIPPASLPFAGIGETLTNKAKGGLLSGGRRALEDENAQLRAAFESIGATELAQIQAELLRVRAERDAAFQDLASVRSQLVSAREELILQEIGIYDYNHPLESAVAYKALLDQLQQRIKYLARNNAAVIGATSWQVNGSAREGARMVSDFSKLMLRAYNNEADNAVRTMKPYKLASAVDRLDKVRGTISKLGKTMSIQVTDEYHLARVEELRVTADYLAKVQEEKEAERAEKERLREEAKARQEYEREMAKLHKEAAHYEAALAAMKANGDEAGTAEALAKLAELNDAIHGIEERAANTRAGYVYVISNFGAFGERMVKIGMTRRLDPLDRVRELGDASVPFRYDVHALIFSEDAVGLENALHREFHEHRVNLVNERREFFYVTPAAVRDALARMSGNLLSFEEVPEALEWHQSENLRRTTASAAAASAPAESATL